MADAPTVHRDIDVPLPAGDVWPLVGDGDGWTDWLVEEADVAVEPGGGGTVVDGGEVRRVRIDRVEPGERVAWTWWPADDPDDASRVDLVVVPGAERTVVRVTETRAARRRAGHASGAAFALAA